MQISNLLLFFVLYLLCFNLLEIEAYVGSINYEIKDLRETDVNLFKIETSSWDIRNSKSEAGNFQIENSTLPKFILLANTINTSETQSFVFKMGYWVPASHKYAVGSLRFWYSDDDFSDGSTAALEIFLSQDPIPTVEQLKEPCFMMSIPGPEKQLQPPFEFIYFGVSHSNEIIYVDVKISIYSVEGKLTKEKSFGLRDLTIHLTNESQAVTYSQTKCPLGQGLDENLICQDCAANCDFCFGPKASQCLSCSPGSHWHGSACTNCHDNCDKCSGPTEHECLGCNVQSFDFRNGTCLDWCSFPFKTSEKSCVKPCRPDEYAFWSTSLPICLANCPPPFIPFTDNNGILICENPCWRNPKEFLYANGSCISVCPDPLTREFSIEGKFCKNPCESTSDYLLSNGSCAKECPELWKFRSEPGVKYCKDPCLEKDIYHYENGSCLPICPSPFVKAWDLEFSYCKNPCKSAPGYIYFGQCWKECLPPFQIRSDSGVSFCENPCFPRDLYLYHNGSCLSLCPEPFVKEYNVGVKLCKNPCEISSDYLYVNGSCFKECPAPLEVRSDSIANYCVNPCDSESLYLYPNGSCISRCSPPLVAVFESGVTFCKNPCKQPSDFLYSNQDCRKECQEPLQIITEPVANFCVNPCRSTNLYLYQNGSCLACKAPLVPVFESETGYCRNPCPSTSDYLSANRFCLKECPAPLQIITESIANFCVNPCHSTNLYLYSNSSCLSTCQYPLKIREEFGAKYCEPPCLTGEYILKYGACSKECPAPLIQKMEKSVGTFCLSPCYDYFIVKNGTCSYDCPPYFETKIEYGMRYCLSPCEDNQYYCPQNRSCLERCPDPFQVKYEIGAKICQAPCSGSREFIYDDQLCYEGCPAPFKIEEPNYCKNPCLKENKYLNSNGACQEACEYPDAIAKKGPYELCMIGLRKAQSAQFLAMREIIKTSNAVSWVGGVLSCLIDAGDPTSMLMTPALKMFQKIIFTETKLPGNTELILNNQGERILSRKFPTEVKLQIVTLVTFSLIAFLISFLLKRVRFSNESKLHQMLIKCDSTLRLNTLIPLFISVNGDILLSCVTDLKSPKSIFCILLTIFRLSQIYKNSRKRREEVEIPKWRFLFEIFTENQKSFILRYFVRIIVYHLVIGFLHDHPQLQAFSMMVLSFGMCFYLIWRAPVKRIISKIQYLIVELALLCFNVIFGLLAIFDFQESDVLGQLMNILYLITSVITAFIIVIKIFYVVYLSWSSLEDPQPGHIQLSEMNQDTQPESVRFEPLNQIEVNPPPNFEGDSSEDNDFIEPSVTIE